MTRRRHLEAIPGRGDRVMNRAARDALTLAIHLLRGWPSGWDILGPGPVPLTCVALAQAQLCGVLARLAPTVELCQLTLFRNRANEVEAASLILMASKVGVTWSAIADLGPVELRETVNGMADICAALAVAVYGRRALARLAGFRAQLEHDAAPSTPRFALVKGMAR